MTPATSTDPRDPALHAADSHDLIRVQGARVNNLKDISIEIPKRRLTVFTGVSGSGKSSLVFDTIAAESRRLIDETYSTFVQVFMPTLARPEVDVLEGLTTAILVDQERLGANPRSTLGTVTDANAMLRSLFSRLGKPSIGGPTAFSFNIPTTRASGVMTGPKGEKKIVQDAVYLGGMCAECEGRGTVSDLDLSVILDESKSLVEGAILVPGYTADGWMVTLRRVRLRRPEEADQGLHREGAPRPPVPADDQGQGQRHQRHLRRAHPEDPQVDVQQGRRLAAAAHQGVRRAGCGLQDLPGLRRHPAQRRGALLEDQGPQHRRRVRDAGHRRGRRGCAASTTRAWRRWSPTCSTSSTRSSRSAWATSRSIAHRARCRAASRSARRWSATSGPR